MDINCDNVRDIISDEKNILDTIKNSPQTYNSILKEKKDNGTCRQILMRRVSKLVKEGDVYKLRIPGTRFGLCLFCVPNHDYKIIVFNNLMSHVRIFYTYNLEYNNSDIKINKGWELKGPNWSKWKKIDECIKLKKYMFRGDCYRIWD